MGIELNTRTNIFRRPNELPFGGTTEGHLHNFDHTTFIIEGGFRIRGQLPEGGMIERRVYAGDSVTIRRDVRHEIHAIGNEPAIEALDVGILAPLTEMITLLRQLLPAETEVLALAEETLDGVNRERARLRQVNRYDCIYAHRTPQGEVVQDYTGWPPAYS